MKRSVINTNIEWAMDLCKRMNFNLPDFFYWTPQEWEEKKDKTEKMTAVAELERAQNKLSNESFVSKAPAALVEKEKEKVHKYSETIASIEQQINAVKNLM